VKTSLRACLILPAEMISMRDETLPSVFTFANRRSFLRVGALGSLGAMLTPAFTAQATSPAPKAKSVIMLWLQGGVSHHESFDPKPDAPSDIRGEMDQIPTKLPGIYFNEHLPKMANLADKISVVRSLKHAEGAHERGSMYVMEGRRPAAATGVSHSGNPELGSIVAHTLGSRGQLPAYFSLPGNDFTSRFTGHGWLPATAGAFRGYQQSSLRTSSAEELARFEQRVALRSQLVGADRTSAAAWQAFDRNAANLILSRQGADAFDLKQEPEAIREMYGLARGRDDDMATFTLTARRLVQAGVRFVTIGRDSWDHHENIFPQLKRRLPLVDAAFSGLLIDLEQNGMLDDTLVVYLTEFGRTPKVNDKAGRDHWPNACSVVFAGAGIKRGQVLGATDRNGAEVIEGAVSPEEIAATILHLVGIPPQTTFLRSDGRPMSFVDGAQPIQALLS
jgi:uncharacterized protein (DUF1501 family)